MSDTNRTDLEKNFHLDETGIRHFQNIEEVRENLSTITFEECRDCYERLGIVFGLNEGKIVSAAYENEMQEQERVAG